MSQGGNIGTPEGSLPSDVATSYVTDNGTAVAQNYVIHIAGSGGASTSATGDVITIAAGEFNWQVVTSANNPVTLVKNSGYIAKGAAQVQFVLPVSATVGDAFAIKGYGNLWTLTENTGQTISLGLATTTVGSGSLTATQVKDGVQLLCVTNNTEFECFPPPLGNPTIV